MKRRPRLVDDRGKARPRHTRLGIADAERAGLDASMARAFFRPTDGNPLVLGLALGLSLAGAPFVALWLSAFVPTAMAVGAAVVLAVGITWSARRWIRKPSTGPDKSLWLAFAVCPACGYSIAGIEPEQDNCRVCPECGGAWRMDEDVPPSLS